jgi:SulP family sulfate permease
MNWVPKSVVCLRYYTFGRFRSDFFAALILSLQLFPLALAIAIASGLRPLYGVYCAAGAGLLAATFGNSKIRVSAPNIVFLSVASSIVAREGVLALSLSTLLAGILLIFFGAIRLGAAIRVLPRPVVLGFLTGIAVLVATQQLRDLIGVNSQIPTSHTPGQVLQIFRHDIDIEPQAIILAIATLAVIVVARKICRHIPASLIVMAVGALLAKYSHFPVHTIAAPYDSHLTLFPLNKHGPLRLDLLSSIVGQAFAIAVLVASESLQALGIASTFTGEDVDPNGELFVHGGVNIAAAFAGGLPASGISSLTSESAQAGAQTPVAGMMQAVFLLALLVPIGPLLPFIPLPVVSGIVVESIRSMASWREISHLLKGRRLELGAWLATSLLTVTADLPVAVAAGMLIALFLYSQQRKLASKGQRM